MASKRSKMQLFRESETHPGLHCVEVFGLLNVCRVASDTLVQSLAEPIEEPLPVSVYGHSGTYF